MRRQRHTKRSTEKSKTATHSTAYCINLQCSNGNRDCDLWTECPMFQGGTVAANEQQRHRQYNPKTAQPAVTEDGEQAAVIEYCELNHIVVVHIPNEGKRSKAYGARMQRLGMKKGFPDLFFPTPCNGYHGLLIEMKRDKKARITAEQKGWLSYLSIQGYRAIACHGANEAIAEIKKYFNL